MRNSPIRFREMMSILALCAAVASMALASCAKTPGVSPEEARAIAKEAYIYGFPMVMNCKTVYQYVVDTGGTEYKGPFNRAACAARLYTPEDKAVVTPNSDTPYCMFWVDLRTEPQVISVPEMEPERYYSIQLIDWYTHNFAYIGTRTTGNGAGRFLLAGPGWEGDAPNGIDDVIRSETGFVFAVIRTQLFDPDDLGRVKEIQDGYGIEPLSTFLGTAAPSAAPKIDFPDWVAGAEFSPAAFEYLDFALDRVGTHPDETALRQRFARIGIGAPGRFAVSELDPVVAAALEAGMRDALAEIKGFIAGHQADPLFSSRLFGTRAFLKESSQKLGLQDFYLFRATGAQMGLYGNTGAEALYPTYLLDAEGKPFDASAHDYVMRFEGGAMPPAKAFWSVSLYDGKTQLFIRNPLERYLLNSSMMDGFVREPDGTIVFYIQKDSPGKAREANWLPAPDGPFYLVMRLYLPEESALEGGWKPPALEKAR